MDERRERDFARARPAVTPAADERVRAEPAAALDETHEPTTAAGRIIALQSSAGNATVSRLLAPQAPDVEQEDSGTAAHPAAAITSAGAPLDASLRAEMEGALGADFSGVRVHEGGEAAASARALGARAYTVGEDVVVGGDGADRRTMAHELAHVVQQRAGAVDGTPTASGYSVSSPDDRFEQAASATAAAIVDGRAPGRSPEVGPAAGAATAQRQAEEEEEETVQLQSEEDEEEEQVQRQPEEDEDEPLQTAKLGGGGR